MHSVFRFAMPLLLCASSVAAQQLPNQGPNDPAIPRTPASTPDAGGRYWQQRADYTIVATLDETRQAVLAEGVLRYANQSPDTLRELWLHQHLNAFRPASRWSAVDARERRERFQSLNDPDYGFERFTADPVIGGRRVRAEYPLAPDSTVVRLALPTPLPPGGQVEVRLAWEARPSTTVRRQGRRDRSFDFAQWYPRVAVYDRHGWKPNALVPAGEFYGEFGTFDVTLVLPQDQIVGATGVPVQGDPGWARVAVNGNAPAYQRDAYGTLTAGPRAEVPSGFRSVRFVARDVHHFGWSVSPHFVYEGATFVRPARAPRPDVRVWDTVAVHALYRSDAESFCAADRNARACIVAARDGWRDGAALRNGARTLSWLEEVFGTYAYPQMTILRRLDGGGTEFPMMMQNGSNSAGLVTHEGAHIYAHGMLANNEWQSGWLDEGLASYVTSWQEGNVRVAVAAALARTNGTDTLATKRRAAMDDLARLRGVAVANGTLDPIGLRGDLFRSFTHYNTAVYRRAEEMYAALHDLLGDADFRTFLRSYYAEWAFRHVDRWAMQGAAERASGQSLGWFFDQWVDRVGVVEYALSDVRTVQEGTGWRTTVRLTRRGAYRHAMPVGVRVDGVWTIVRGDPLKDDAELSIVTAGKPDAVVLDPYGATD